MEFRPGQRFRSLWVEHEIGRGAFGTVYLARDTLIGRRVALKSISAENGEIPESVREQILTEARLIGNLQSPHVVTLYRVHPTPDGDLLQEMEFVDGGSLEDRIERGKPWAIEDATQVFTGICAGLRAAHAARIVHGDIKPANVMLTREGTPKLMDFGVARMLETGIRREALGGFVVGSPLYMAPEVISGDSTGMVSDIWSAFVVFYQLLCGRLPFDASTFEELTQKVLFTDFAPLGPDVPREIEDLVSRGLTKAPAERTASVDEVLEELERLAAGQVGLVGAEVRASLTNCSPPPSTFVGREAEREEIAALAGAEGRRLLTLTGPGGIGKTRLSQEVCLEVAADFEGGAWFVDLSEVLDRDGIAQAVAEALSAPITGASDPVDAVAELLALRPPLLLVLDNFEQIRDLAGETVGAWLERAPDARFVVTSRVRLGLDGERVYSLAPLGTGEEGEGVRLFADRAREVQAEFELDDDTRKYVAGIVRELDGMPLAIELAAARIRIMRPDEIASNLARKFQLLKSTRRDIAARQRTLTAAIEWSFDLLAGWEREAYLQACLFRDGFSLEAADDVLDLSAWEDAPDALGVATGLRDKSLLLAFDAGQQTRLSMYRAVREYGEARWRRTASPDRQERLDRRHAAHYLGYAKEWGRRIPGLTSQDAMDRIARELGNLAAVQERALLANDAVTAARAALAVAETMRVRSPPSHLVAVIDRALESRPVGREDLLAAMLAYHGSACRMAGDWDRAVESSDRAVELARGIGADRLLCRSLVEQAEIHRNRGDLGGALAAFTEAEEVAARNGDGSALAMATGGRGMVLGQQRDYDAAFLCFCEAESAARTAGDQATLALHLHNRGVVYESRAELDSAIECYREAEDIARHSENLVRAAVSLGGRANALAQRGDIEEALRCYAEAEQIARDLGVRQRVAQIVGNRGGVLSMAGRLTEALACYEEAEEIARDLGDLRRVATTLGQRARLFAKIEEPEDALACFEEAEEVCREIGDRFALARNICDRGALYHQLDRPEEAEEAIREGLRIYEELHAGESHWCFCFRSVLADVCDAQSRCGEAADIAAQAVALADRLGFTEEHGDREVRESLARMRQLAR